VAAQEVVVGVAEEAAGDADKLMFAESAFDSRE